MLNPPGRFRFGERSGDDGEARSRDEEGVERDGREFEVDKVGDVHEFVVSSFLAIIIDDADVEEVLDVSNEYDMHADNAFVPGGSLEAEFRELPGAPNVRAPALSGRVCRFMRVGGHSRSSSPSTCSTLSIGSLSSAIGVSIGSGPIMPPFRFRSSLKFLGPNNEICVSLSGGVGGGLSA